MLNLFKLLIMLITFTIGSIINGFYRLGQILTYGVYILPMNAAMAAGLLAISIPMGLSILLVWAWYFGAFNFKSKVLGMPMQEMN